jgi:hypothetical protein
MSEASPYYYSKAPNGRWLVPRDPIENVKWRLRCRERALVDKKFQDAFYQACMDDLLFFMAAVCWGLDPRARIKIQPFIPYSHQEKVFLAMDEAIDDSAVEEKPVDVILDKSRAQGGTLGYLWIDLRRWLRDPMFSAGYVTRNEVLMDSKTDSDALFWKLDWAINKLPVWMLPNGFSWRHHRSYTTHSLLNPENGSSLVGYAAGQDVGAGGRKSIFTIDEAGARDFVSGGKDEAVQESLHDVTNCAAAGTLVVTDHGLVPIEAVELRHRVWDGTMWVTHEGCVYQGEQHTILSYGVKLTPDHLVLTHKGWKHAIDRFDREDVRLPDGYQERWFKQVESADVAVSVQVRQGQCNSRGGSSGRFVNELRLQIPTAEIQDADVQLVGRDDSALHEPESSQVSIVWCSRHNGVRPLESVFQFPGGHGGAARGLDIGSDRQQWELRPKQLSMGNAASAAKQQAEYGDDRDLAGANGRSGYRERSWIDNQRNHGAHQEGLDGGRSFASIPNPQAVYDLLNCGPRRAFTVIDDSGRPLLVHNCIRMVSARYVDQGVFNEACENPDPDDVYLVLDWKDHPSQSKDSYVVHDGRPVARKPEEQESVDAYHRDNPDLQRRLERKGYKWEGVVRSPWYNRRCLRTTATPRLIASQLDRNPRGAVGKVFPVDLLDRMKREHCKPPVWRGQPVFDSETLKLTGLIPRDDGQLKLWFKPGIDNMPPLGPFTAGCDIASGGVSQYATNSTMSALDDRTGEQVLEYAIKGLEPRPFARRVVGLCLWLRNALLGWEDSGVSGGFAKEVMEVLYYGNVFFRDVTQLGSQKKSRKPGWPCRDADKADMFEQMALAMEVGRFIPRSEDMIMECGEYEWEGSKIIHAPTKNRGATEKNHADRAVAGGGCWLVYANDNAGDRVDTSEENGTIAEYGSFAWREEQERKQAKIGSPRFGIRDVVGYS